MAREIGRREGCVCVGGGGVVRPARARRAVEAWPREVRGRGTGGAGPGNHWGKASAIKDMRWQDGSYKLIRVSLTVCAGPVFTPVAAGSLVSGTANVDHSTLPTACSLASHLWFLWTLTFSLNSLCHTSRTSPAVHTNKYTNHCRSCFLTCECRQGTIRMVWERPSRFSCISQVLSEFRSADWDWEDDTARLVLVSGETHLGQNGLSDPHYENGIGIGNTALSSLLRLAEPSSASEITEKHKYYKKRIVQRIQARANCRPLCWRLDVQVEIEERRLVWEDVAQRAPEEAHQVFSWVMTLAFHHMSPKAGRRLM